MKRIILFALVLRSIVPSWAFLSSSKKRMSSVLRATPVKETFGSTVTTEKTHTCDFCDSKFTSRNALFRHLRADGCTIDNPRQPNDSHQDPIVKQSVAIQFGYVSTKVNGEPFNEWAGQRVVEAVEDTLRRAEQSGDDLDFRLQESRTHSSVAKLRSAILTQDPDCHAARDTIVLTGSCLQSALPRLEQALDDVPSSIENGSVRIWGCKLLWPDLKSEYVRLHAERGCSQMVYHYLVPLSWLPDADLLQNHWKGWKEKPPTNSLKRFKAALRCAESAMASGDNPQVKISTGRFGRLGAKERRAWHNFADPTLRGKASPNQEPVWRVVDACRMTEMVNFGKDDAAVVVEVKGDAFVPQQIPRIVGTALAIAHDWLPSGKSIWESSLLNPESVMETVFAPPGRLYLADCRFHFEESRTSGVPLFETDICGKVLGNGGKKAATWTAKEILKRLSSDEIREAEKEWLNDVRDNVAPRINESLQWSNPAASDTSDIDVDEFSQTPKEYETVLELLRELVADGKWPDTSVARSSVIRRSTNTEGNSGKAGSFTVVNPKVLGKLQEGQETIDLPLGNQLFPGLVKAVFDLEEAISCQAKTAEIDPDTGRMKVSTECTSRRPQSSHCAINAQAQFTPHVDSGRGAGQSLSVIVGLGDYRQGELMVEGLPCDIRFQPLEFNGWALRHWTAQYKGERFSLVWFTPELKG